ncbi:FecCD family ABC transporter permease [Brevibacillus sp. SYSU BS000544]|uniref:FecCD family ABC transporter permease n=1 Tax=Brevibacillus sp. SYSU BS000544 TaxID=3416443 RepID=UPI003CE47886
MAKNKMFAPNKSYIQNGMILLAGFILLLLGFLLSISVGSAQIHWWNVWESLFSSQSTKESLIVSTIRLPRTVLAAIIGANLAVAGAIMQAITQNPLASPQLFGVNAGAALTVVGGIVLFPALGPTELVMVAFIGAGLGGAIVYSLGAMGGLTPVKLALAGMSVHLLLSSITEAMIIFQSHSTDQILFWLAGSIDGSDWGDIQVILPWTIGGLLFAFGISRSINVLRLGDSVAKGLGQKTGWVRVGSGLIVLFLAGSAVAVAGPIGFVGLMVPHLVRFFVGEDYRLVLPFCAIFGALLLVYADIASRFIAFPYESPVGIVTALLGAPFFLYLAMKERKKK